MGDAAEVSKFVIVARATVVTNIRVERARAHLTGADIGQRMYDIGFRNWHRTTLSRIEVGKRQVTADEIFGLAQALGTTTDVLMRMF